MVDLTKRGADDDPSENSAGAAAPASGAGKPSSNGVSKAAGATQDAPRLDARGRPLGAPADAPRPKSIMLAVYAVGAQIVFAAIVVVLNYLLSDELRRLLRHANDTAGKNKKAYCDPAHPVKDCLDLTKTVHAIQTQAVIGTILISAVLVYAMLRAYRGIRTGRTIYIAISVVGGLLIGFAGSPLAIASAFATTAPGATKIVETLAGVASVLAIVLMFRPDAARFFAAHSPLPVARASGGQRSGGFGGLFRPAAPRDTQSMPARGPRSSAASRAEGRIAKAKSRNDAEAIARGAELARQRAKAAKTRRTPR